MLKHEMAMDYIKNSIIFIPSYIISKLNQNHLLLNLHWKPLKLHLLRRNLQLNYIYPCYRDDNNRRFYNGKIITNFQTINGKDRLIFVFNTLS